MPRWRRALPLLVAVQLLLATVAVLWGWLRDIPWTEALRLDAWVPVGLLAGLGVSLASTALFERLRRVPWAHADWLVDEFLGPLFSGLPLRWALVLALLSGFCEEALFRGVLQAEIGLVPASLVFGLLHTGDRRLLATGAWSVVVGAALGLAYQATGNLAAPVAMHAASNFLSFVHLSRWEEPGSPGAGS